MRSLVLVLSVLAMMPGTAQVTRIVVPKHEDLTPQPSHAELHEILSQALEEAAKVPAENRRDAAYAIAAGVGTRAERIQRSLLKIALRPSSPGWWNLVRAVSSPREATGSRPGEIAADRASAIEFLESVYRTRAGVTNEAALQWQHGLAEMLFSLGKFDEALMLEREVVTRRPNDTYKLILLAMMEKVQGNDEPFARISANCPDSNFSDDERGRRYCFNVIVSIGQRLLDVIDPKLVPPAIHEMMSGGGDWKERMHALEVMRTRISAADQEKELLAIAASADAPSWAIDDAIYMLARLHTPSTQSAPRIFELLECWLARRGVKFDPIQPETWQKLSEIPYRRFTDRAVDVGSDSCYRHHGEDNEAPSNHCLFATLGLYLQAAYASRNHEAARLGVERMTALTMRTDEGYSSLSFSIAATALNAPTDVEREQIYRYVATLKAPVPFREYVEQATRKDGTRPPAPWTSAPKAPATARCP